MTGHWSLPGAIAQLGERVLCKHEVVGSIPSGSTRSFGRVDTGAAWRFSDCRLLAIPMQHISLRILGSRQG